MAERKNKWMKGKKPQSDKKPAEGESAKPDGEKKPAASERRYPRMK